MKFLNDEGYKINKKRINLRWRYSVRPQQAQWWIAWNWLIELRCSTNSIGSVWLVALVSLECGRVYTCLPTYASKQLIRIERIAPLPRARITPETYLHHTAAPLKLLLWVHRRQRYFLIWERRSFFSPFLFPLKPKLIHKSGLLPVRLYPDTLTISWIKDAKMPALRGTGLNLNQRILNSEWSVNRICQFVRCWFFFSLDSIARTMLIKR